MFTMLAIKKLGGYFWRRFVWLTAQSSGPSRGNMARKHRFPYIAGIF
jgi:hypothetical protein